jgi:copper homeostasis protein
MIREACVEGYCEALRAQELGAERVELCDNLAVGGTTPSWGTIVTCKKYLKIPVMVMIRPRGGDFVYNETEMEIMAEDIRMCRKAGADGIAIGLLTPDREIDLTGLHDLVKNAGIMQITFHKAIDETADIERETVRLAKSGLAQRVLTSGRAATAMAGEHMINRMITLAGRSLTILAAGKVTRENLDELSRRIPAKEFHGRKIVGDLTC